MRTFILGAGASMHFGLPSGIELKSLLLEELNSILSGMSSRKQFFSLSGLNRETVDAFIEGFEMGKDFTTIDYFLGAMEDEEFKKIGNALIALVISKKQSQINFSTNQDWYELFFELIKNSSEDEVKNTKIITFNYDTSLEKFIEKRISAETPRIIQNEIKEKLSNLEFIHPHGQLPFAESFNIANVFTKSPIKTISDDFSSDIKHQKAKKIFSTSNDVIFMGFGYHNEILSNLQSEEYSSKKPIFPGSGIRRNFMGTTVGVDIESIKYHSPEIANSLPKKEIDCKTMMECISKYKNVNEIKFNLEHNNQSTIAPPIVHHW